MKRWNSSPHPISDIRDWYENGRLELRPDFQRREVWSDAARIMLMDTILRDVPMPKIFLSNFIKDDRTYRIVIDGQQRISAILSFLRNEFCLKKPYEGEYFNLFYKDLPGTVKNDFLGYPIDFNEVTGISDEELREVYSRVNKYTFALNKQELRRADFPGKFLKLSEEVALEEFWETARVFTVANRRRLGDVEFVSELLAGLIDGAQEKKQTLDEFYQKYAKWDEEELTKVKSRFLLILMEIEQLFSYKDNGITQTRFRQKSDFYSLFLAIDSLHREGFYLIDKNIENLQRDLEILNYNIEPHNHCSAFREYATRCLSDANSKSSRLWRQTFLKKILIGTYQGIPPTTQKNEFSFASIIFDLDIGTGFCPSAVHNCPICDKEIQNESFDERILVWNPNEIVFQLSNAEWVHASCYSEKSDFYTEKNIDTCENELLNEDTINPNQVDFFASDNEQ
jgi:transcription termination factor NusB